MLLKYGTIFPAHYISHIKPQLLLKSLSQILPDDGNNLRVNTIYFGPRTELLHGNIIFLPESQLVPSIKPSRLLSFQQVLSLSFNATLRIIRLVYLILISNSKLDMVSRCSNTLIIISRIALITAGLSWLNTLIQGNSLFIRFLFYSVRL